MYLPEPYILTFVFIFGTLIGSFLNVVIYRVHTGKSLGGHSHCMSCGKGLTWYELIPVISYVIQRGRCRGCSSYVPMRYLAVELLTGCLFVLVWSVYASDPILVALYAIVVALLVVIAVYDLRHTIIPDEWVLGLCAAAVLILLYGGWGDLPMLATHLLSGVGAFAFFGGLWLVSRGRWIGLGDAKLAFALAAIVGFPAAFSLIVFSFWIGAVVSLTLLALGRMHKTGTTTLPFLRIPLTIKSEVPFAPFLILGFLAVLFFHANVFTILTAILPY